MYFCSQLAHPLYPGSHSMVTANVSAFVTVRFCGGCGVVRITKSFVRATIVATSLETMHS